MNNQNRTPLLIGIAIVVLCLCIAIPVMLFGAGALFTARPVDSPDAENITEVVANVTATPSFTPAPSDTPAPTLVPPVDAPTPAPTISFADSVTLETLLNTYVPQGDRRELAMRLLKIPDIPEVVSTTPANHQIGDELVFWAGNVDTDENFQVTAKLIYATEHAYFFAQSDLRVNESDVRQLVDDFENHSYPTTREFFGSEWSPGVDGDPHIYILYVENLGFTVAAYYSSSDEYSSLAHEQSNEKEMFYVNADAYSRLSDPEIGGTLTHEFQHMIHWANDRNEETWMNEGSSVLSEVLSGYSAGFDYSFLSDPDSQLNTWTDGSPGSNAAPHYGAGFLFMAYFLDRFGNEATQALVKHPENGLLAVDTVLDEIGSEQSAQDFFADWVIANYLGDPSLGDGRYGYHRYTEAPHFIVPTERIDDCSVPTTTNTVHQYGTDYIEINCSGSYTFEFTGSQSIQVVPTEPYSGQMAFWGNRADDSDTTLTREFDLTGLDSATLIYQAWWQIETDWDYAYVMASTDDGATWDILRAPSSSDSNPNGNSFGWAYHDDSGVSGNAQWVEEQVDLSDYAGQVIQIRFEYITDAAVNRPGFMVDDIAIPELDYFTDFEENDGGWEAAGFVRMDNLLPQEWIVQVIQNGEVSRVSLDGTTAKIPLNGPAVIVISGATMFTTEIASYDYAIN